MNHSGKWLAAMALAAVLPGSAAAAPGQPAVISLGQLRSTMKQHQGRVLVLHVWASWCQPCVDELPMVATLAKEARARGFEVFSVSLDQPNPPSVARMMRVLEERGSAAINRTILRLDDADAVVAQVNPEWEGDIPAFFAYDRAGKLRRSHVGEMTREAFDGLVGDLLPNVKK